MGKGKKRGRDLKEDGAHARIDHEEEKKIEEDVSQETVSEKKIKKTKKMTQNSSDDQLAPQTPSRDLATSRKQDDIQNKPRNFSSNSTKLKSTNNQSNSSSPWNFIVEYNDHFETPQQAYVDLLQVLIYVAKDIGKALEDVIIYDPYYCQGRVITLLQSLGFRNIINNNRDFYRDISSNTIPEYDILVTNPPYSGEHKVKLLQYLQTIDRPYALLLPAYTATKSYWKDFIRFENQRRRNESRPGDAVIYLLPPSSYEYSHPEGTGT